VQRHERARLLPVCAACHPRSISDCERCAVHARMPSSTAREVRRARAAAQFVRRMGFQADQPMVMFRPTEVEVAAAQPDAQPARYMPATVVDRIDLFFMVKYWLRFDDGLVRRARVGSGLPTKALHRTHRRVALGSAQRPCAAPSLARGLSVSGIACAAADGCRTRAGTRAADRGAPGGRRLAGAGGQAAGPGPARVRAPGPGALPRVRAGGAGLRVRRPRGPRAPLPPPVPRHRSVCVLCAQDGAPLSRRCMAPAKRFTGMQHGLPSTAPSGLICAFGSTAGSAWPG